ncbi:hypothetical protein NKG05_26980 [Oerskovia sp. M15]
MSMLHGTSIATAAKPAAWNRGIGHASVGGDRAVHERRGDGEEDVEDEHSAYQEHDREDAATDPAFLAGEHTVVLNLGE